MVLISFFHIVQLFLMVTIKINVLVKYIIILMLGLNFQKIVHHHRLEKEFQNLGSIGSGGFAEVFHVKNKTNGKSYAAKIVKIKPSNSQEQTETRLYKSLQQAKLHSQLNSELILKYHGCWMELQQFTEEQRLQQQEQDMQESQFEMVIVDDQYDSGQIMFASASHNTEQQNTLSKKKMPTKNASDSSHDPKRLTTYKLIKLIILSQLCQMNLQTFIYQRNLQKLGNGRRKSEQKNWQQNIQMAIDITKGLSYLHSKRIIHRDIKLHNIVLNQKRNCKLIDFGIAKKIKYWKTSTQEKITKTTIAQINAIQDNEEFSKSVGTKLFSSPEQANSDKYDYRTDIFSLAIVIVLLFSTFTTAHQQRDMIDLIRQRKLQSFKMPLPLKEVLHRCLGLENERPSLHEVLLTLRLELREITKSKLLPITFYSTQICPDSHIKDIKINDLKVH